jgi:hypothetical protein
MPKVPHKLVILLERLKEHGPVLPENGEWRCRCPAHEDGSPSLYTRQGDGRILLRCNAGCDFDAIIDKLDLLSSDLTFAAEEPWVDFESGSRGGENSTPVPDPEGAGGDGASCFADARHGIYSALLAALSLSDDHQAALQKRGLDAEAIALRGYRSCSTFAAHQAIGLLLKSHSKEALLAVPGFIQRGDRVELVAGKVGLLVPVRGLDGKIQALKIRHDRASGAKYTFRFCAKVADGGEKPVT